MIDLSAFSFDQMITNLTFSFKGLVNLIEGLAYITGIALVARGVMMYRAFANQTFGSAQRGEIAGPLVHIVVGVIMIWLPAAVSGTLVTVYGTSKIGATSSLLSYSSVSDYARWRQLADVIVMYMKLIGLIAFFRGWVILSKMGHSGAQPGSIGKGLTHIVGGILLINIIDTVKVLSCTLGYGCG